MTVKNIFIPGLVPIEDDITRLNTLFESENMSFEEFHYYEHSKKRNFIEAIENDYQEKYKKEKVNIFGYSAGSNLAILFANRFNNVDNLILLAPSLKFGNYKQNIEDLLRNKNSEDFFDIEEYSKKDGISRLFKMVINLNPRIMNNYYKSAKLAKKGLSICSTPTLLIRGENDALIPEKSVKYLYNNLNCEKGYIFVKNGRHRIHHSTRNEELKEEIVHFIKTKKITKDIIS